MSGPAQMPKPRCDAWDAPLTEAQRWEVYDRLRRAPWQRVAKWAAEEFGVEAPSRAAIYRFSARLRKLESAHRVEEALLARDEAGALVAAKCDDKTLAASFVTLAQNIAVRDPRTAKTYVGMALQLADAARRRAEIELKARAQETRDAQLRLAREKFEAAERRLAAVQEAVKSAKATGGGLSEETLRKIEEAAGLL